MATLRQFADLSGNWALVTGSSSGIGKAVALEFAQAGADVLVHFRNRRNEAEEVASAIRAIGRRSDVLQADVGDPRQSRAMIDQAWEFARGEPIMVCNAGADLLTGAEAELGYADKLQRLLDVDVRGGMLSAREAAAKMREQGGGTILTIGWDQSDRGMGGESGELFAAAKNAVMGFTRSLAVSFAPTVRVNCIAPGWIKTAWGEQASDVWQARVLEETPLRRWGTPEDIAKLARFLASPDAAYLTGQVINANGGAVR